MRYLMLVHDDPDYTEPIGDTDPEPWVEDTTRRGVRIMGDRLRPAEEATTVRVRKGETVVADGPFVETREQIGGFDLLEAANREEAIAIAAAHPAARFGVIELREIWQFPWDE